MRKEDARLLAFENNKTTISMSRCQAPRMACHVCDKDRVQGSGFRVQGSGFRVQGSGFRVQGSGFRVQGLGFRV